MELSRHPNNPHYGITAFLIVVAIIMMIMLIGCKKEPQASPNSPTATKTVKYEALGQCCDMDVTYYQNGNSTTFHTTVPSWSHTFEAPIGTILSISANSYTGSSPNWDRVNIYINGLLTKADQDWGFVSVQDTVK